MAERSVASSHRPWARAGRLLLLAFTLASSGTACGDTDDQAAAPAAGKGGGSGASSTGGAAGRGGTSVAGGESGRGETGTAGAGGDDPRARCSDAALVWKSANKTNYTSYPDPGSEECVKYNGCMWAGQFAACSDKKVEGWVAQHDIVAAFPDFDTLALHDLCLRKGDAVMIVTVLDTCGDSDCSGCCTENQGSADELIDVESYTNERWGVPDGGIEWADLGPTRGDGCG